MKLPNCLAKFLVLTEKRFKPATLIYCVDPTYGTPGGIASPLFPVMVAAINNLIGPTEGDE